MRFISTFLAVSLAIIASVVLFAPERLPPGYGMSEIPVAVNIKEDTAMKMLGAITGNKQQSKSLSISNDSAETLHNLEVRLIDADGSIKNVYQLPSLIGKGSFRLGWAQDWRIQTGDTVQMRASLYYPKKWAL